MQQDYLIPKCALEVKYTTCMWKTYFAVNLLIISQLGVMFILGVLALKGVTIHIGTRKFMIIGFHLQYAN